MIEYEKRAMIEAEDKYTFRQSTQISMQTGLIGHLRADMDTDGNGFFSSWFDFREDLKTDEFKAELDEVINSLREEGDILHNRRALAKYCYCTPQSRMQEEPGYYGVRVDTEKYAYLLRLNPDRGEYNLYCYCYRRDWLDQHLKDAEKGIRFIDSHYKELFRIPDGGKVKIHYSWNEDQIRTCRYIDDYHVEIGSNLYHICEFAERTEYGGHTCEPVRDNLPERCYSVLSGSDEIIIIKRGEKGYFKTDIPVTDKDEARSIANEYNAKLGVSKAQEEAMKAGSMFGFQVPAADPRNYDADAYPTAITQNVEYLLDSVQASTMLSNSEFVVMLNQAASDRGQLAKLLNISNEQMSYITNADAGCGLIKYGSALVPFINRFPQNTKLYQLMTTRPGEGKFARGRD